MWWPENVFLYNFCRSSLEYAVNARTPDLLNFLSGTLEGIDIPCKRYVILGRSWSVESVGEAFKLRKKRQQKCIAPVSFSSLFFFYHSVPLNSCACLSARERFD